MIKTLISTLVILFSLTAATVPQHGGEVDLAASSVTWLGKKVVGEHSGTINLKSANLEFKNHKLTGGQFVMDMTTIACTDLEGEWAQKLVGHLSNEDFFEVNNHATSELKITEVRNTKLADNYSITGDLTIKGITHPIQFNAMVSAHSAKATIKIDRTKYGIKYGSGSFFDDLGDKTIDNEFTLTINLVLK